MKTTLALLVCLLGACSPTDRVDPCENVPGSCLVVSLHGTGNVDRIDVWAELYMPAATKAGMVDGGPCALPCVVQVKPPAGVRSSQISTLILDVYKGLTVIRTIKIPGLAWPEGSHIEANYYLGVVQ